MHLVFVETNQTGIGPHQCQALMRQVDAFNARFLASCPVKPVILVTGRNAYVDEISRAMRFDIVSTLLGSVSWSRWFFTSVSGASGRSWR